VYFEVLPYRLNETTGYIDYDALEKNALLYRPKLIVSGASAYPRHIDYPRLRAIADKVGAYFMMDMAHISGLIAGRVLPSPFPYADIVTTTTHKSLRGPRGAMIFFRKGVRKEDKEKKTKVMYELETAVNASVFPGHQGGPHNHTIAALAVALKQANTQEFRNYSKQIVLNNARLAERLLQKGYKLVSGGTDNHLILVDLRPKDLNGAKVERVLELANVALNKNTVPGDVSAMNPGGIRLGSPALTSRGMVEKDFDIVAEIVHKGIEIAKLIQDKAGKGMKEWRASVGETGENWGEIQRLKLEVVQFARYFPPVGFEVSGMKHQA